MSTADTILIYAPGPAYNRFQVARDIQNACNTSGVARELIRMMEDAALDRACGRGRLAHDPAVVAVIDKLSSLMRLRSLQGTRPMREARSLTLCREEREGGGKGRIRRREERVPNASPPAAIPFFISRRHA
jgi:hypothetical protein